MENKLRHPDECHQQYGGLCPDGRCNGACAPADADEAARHPGGNGVVDDRALLASQPADDVIGAEPQHVVEPDLAGACREVFAYDDDEADSGIKFLLFGC